jgi:hypothetical protein
VIDPLAHAIIAASLALAVWGGTMAALDRKPDRWLNAFNAALWQVVILQLVIAFTRLSHLGADVGLFIGYAVTAALLPPAAAVLAWMEPTRWGSAILGAGGLIVAPLTLRLLQIWDLAGA